MYESAQTIPASVNFIGKYKLLVKTELQKCKMKQANPANVLI
jgi:hypothetical protein